MPLNSTTAAEQHTVVGRPANAAVDRDGDRNARRHAVCRNLVGQALPFDSDAGEQQESEAYRGEWLGPVGAVWLVIALGLALWGAAIWGFFRFLI